MEIQNLRIQRPDGYEPNSNNKPVFLNRLVGGHDFEVKTSGTYEHRL
jgi:hypothetical protein